MTFAHSYHMTALSDSESRKAPQRRCVANGEGTMQAVASLTDLVLPADYDIARKPRQSFTSLPYSGAAGPEARALRGTKSRSPAHPWTLDSSGPRATWP